MKIPFLKAVTAELMSLWAARKNGHLWHYPLYQRYDLRAAGLKMRMCLCSCIFISIRVCLWAFFMYKVNNSVVYADLKAKLFATACKIGSFQNKLAKVGMQQGKCEAQTACAWIIHTPSLQAWSLFYYTFNFYLHFNKMVFNVSRIKDGLMFHLTVTEEKHIVLPVWVFP